MIVRQAPTNKGRKPWELAGTANACPVLDKEVNYMAYKNSANVKFNDATDLIIMADPDGTVESCFNRSDNIEYITPYSPVVISTVKVTNTLSNTRNVYYIDNTLDYLKTSILNLSANTTTTLSAVNNTIMFTNTGYTWNIISGDAEIMTDVPSRIIIKGNCELEIVNI